MTEPTPSRPDPDHAFSAQAYDPWAERPPADGYGGEGPYPGGSAGPETGRGAGYGAGAPGPVILRELREAVFCMLAVAVTGVILGAVWAWLAPRVPLVSDGKAVLLKDPEGEEAMGADGTFLLLALAAGAVSGLVVFLVRRRGGVGIAGGLALGGLLASVVAWRFGIMLGPSPDVVAAAKAAGTGVTFDGPLSLKAMAVLLAWPLAANAVHLLLTGLFVSDEDAGPSLAPDRV